VTADRLRAPALALGLFLSFSPHMLSHIDINDKRLTELDALALQRMLEKRENYVYEGRARDAHGLGTGIWILWKTLTREQPDTTGYGGF